MEVFSSLELANKGDFPAAEAKVLPAIQVFNELEMEEIRDLATAFSFYFNAIKMLGQKNFGGAIESFKNIKQYLSKAGEFSSKYELFIEKTEPELLFIIAMKALTELDYPEAKILIEKASEAASSVARKHFDEGDLEYNLFIGYSHYFRANYQLQVASRALASLQLNSIIADSKLVDDAVMSSNYLRIVSDTSVPAKSAFHISVGMVHLLTAISGLAKIMQKVINSTFKEDLNSIEKIQTDVETAKEKFSLAGSEAIVFVRKCDMYLAQINSLQLLSKPKRSDWGKLSGLVSCALFLPLFLCTSWANNAFEVKLQPRELMGTSMALALIGGFGYGALRFKSIFSLSGNGSNSD